MSEGHVYVIQHGDGPVKIGKSQNPEQRFRSIRAKCPFCEYELVDYIQVDGILGSGIVESAAHKQFKEYRMRGEWFDIPADVALSYIKEVSEKPIVTDPELWNSIVSSVELKPWDDGVEYIKPKEKVIETLKWSNRALKTTEVMKSVGMDASRTKRALEEMESEQIVFSSKGKPKGGKRGRPPTMWELVESPEAIDA